MTNTEQRLRQAEELLRSAERWISGANDPSVDVYVDIRAFLNEPEATSTQPAPREVAWYHVEKEVEEAYIAINANTDSVNGLKGRMEGFEGRQKELFKRAHSIEDAIMHIKQDIERLNTMVNAEARSREQDAHRLFGEWGAHTVGRTPPDKD